MKIAITKEHYETARKCKYPGYNSSTCVLHHALRPVLKEGIKFAVGQRGIYLNGIRRDPDIPHTPETADIVRRFDEGEVIEPCEVRINIPEELIAVK